MTSNKPYLYSDNSKKSGTESVSGLPDSGSSSVSIENTPVQKLLWERALNLNDSRDPPEHKFQASEDHKELANSKEMDMKSGFYNAQTLFWTIVAAFTGVLSILAAMASMSIQTTQSIRDEMAAQNAAVLYQIKSELTHTNSKIENLENKIQSNSEIQELKTKLIIKEGAHR